MQETFSLFGLQGYAYGLCVAAATLLLAVWMGVLSRRRGLPAGTVQVFGITGILAGILCARTVFCLFNLSFFVETCENPALMLRFWDGGLSMAGLLGGLLLAAFITARMMRIRFAVLADVLTVPLGLFIAVCRLAEIFTELGVGKVVEENALIRAIPWLTLTESMGVFTEHRLAVFRYEALAAFLIFAVMLLIASRARRNAKVKDGDISLIFFSLYGASQMLLESMRDDGHLLVIFLRISQVAAALMPLIAAFVFSRCYLRAYGKANRRIFCCWALLALLVGAGVLLEFSLDGRLAWGSPSMMRDYLIMAAVCVTLFAVPMNLLMAVRKSTGCGEALQSAHKE